LNATVTLTLVVETTVLFAKQYIYSELICERKITILSWIPWPTRGNKLCLRHTIHLWLFICENKIQILLCTLKFQSGHDHHLLYQYNPHSDLDLSGRNPDTIHLWLFHMKEKLKSFHAYWSFRADTTITFYIYIP
jgi:hypothetical protein